MKKFLAFITGLSLVPALALAQAIPNFSYADSWINKLISYLRIGITVVMILMTLFFLINVFRFISDKDPKTAAEKKKLMINGLIGLFVAVGVWGIIRLAGNTLGIDTSNQNGVNTPGITCPPGMYYSQSQGACTN